MEKPAILKVVVQLILAVLGLIIILAVLKYYNPIPSLISPDWALAIVTGTATVVLVIITALQMLEARKLRYESVRPNLSLEPAEFTIGGGFIMVSLVNGGVVARDLEIDVDYQGNKDLLCTSSIGANQKVTVLMGNFPEAGGNAKVAVRYHDMYGKAHTETLCIDFDTINKVKRRIVRVTNPSESIANKIEDLKSEVRGLRH
jgi:hypothetical protein